MAVICKPGYYSDDVRNGLRAQIIRKLVRACRTLDGWRLYLQCYISATSKKGSWETRGERRRDYNVTSRENVKVSKV